MWRKKYGVVMKMAYQWLNEFDGRNGKSMKILMVSNGENNGQ